MCDAQTEGTPTLPGTDDYVTRHDYPEVVATDESIAWSEYVEEDAGDLGFRGEIPWAIFDDYHSITRYKLTLLRDESSLSSYEIVVDFGVGVYQSYVNHNTGESWVCVLRSAGDEAINEWLGQHRGLDEDEYWENEFFDRVFSGFQFGPPGEGDAVLELFDSEGSNFVQVVRMADGRFSLNASEPRGSRVLVVETLAEVHQLVYGQLMEGFDSGLGGVAPDWTANWERLTSDLDKPH